MSRSTDGAASSRIDRTTPDSPAPMPATLIAEEGAGRGVVGAITLGAESGVAAFHRCISSAGRRRGRGQRGFRRGRASVQNVHWDGRTRTGLAPEWLPGRILVSASSPTEALPRQGSWMKSWSFFLYRQMREFSGTELKTVRRPGVPSGARASHFSASKCSDASS